MGTDSKVQGHSHVPTWDVDIIYFFMFNLFLTETVKSSTKTKLDFVVFLQLQSEDNLHNRCVEVNIVVFSASL